MKLHNIGAPPRSQANYKFIDDSKYLLVSLKEIEKFFNSKKSTLVKRIEKYINKNAELVKKDYIGKYTVLKEVDEQDDKTYETISDINKILSIILRTYHGLYVPNKELIVTIDRFKCSYLIKVEDIENGK